MCVILSFRLREWSNHLILINNKIFSTPILCLIIPKQYFVYKKKGTGMALATRSRASYNPHHLYAFLRM